MATLIATSTLQRQTAGGGFLTARAGLIVILAVSLPHEALAPGRCPYTAAVCGTTGLAGSRETAAIVRPMASDAISSSPNCLTTRSSGHGCSAYQRRYSGA